jgi:hypothetical protein
VLHCFTYRVNTLVAERPLGRTMVLTYPVPA